jgi:hypothetical protein
MQTKEQAAAADLGLRDRQQPADPAGGFERVNGAVLTG